MDVTMCELDQMPLHMYMHTTSLSQIPVTAATNKFQGWQYYVGSFLKQHSQQLSHSFDIATVIDREQHWFTFKYFHDDSHSSLLLYRTLQPEYQYAHYLSEVKCFSNMRLLSRFRSGCHGLTQVDGRTMFTLIGKTGFV